MAVTAGKQLPQRQTSGTGPFFPAVFFAVSSDDEFSVIA